MSATMNLTFNGVAIEMTADDPEELVRMTSLLTALEGPAKNAPKGRKETTKKAAPKVRLVNQHSLPALNKAAGTRFRKAVCFVEAVRDGKVQLPEGYAFGPKYQAYLTSGQSRKDFFS